MKPTTVILFLLCLFVFPITSMATEPGFNSSKPTDHVRTRETSDSRSGGETIADAIEIELPFYDSGATCDNIDDYNEDCPYLDSTSADVVYTFVAQNEEMIRIDLCGSLYDTKVFLYNEDLYLIACNDDFYIDDVCGTYVSLIESAPVEQGVRYYVVVDGFGGDCGTYYMTVGAACENMPCIYAYCPDDGISENEGSLVNGYVDNYNSGCSSDQPVFQELTVTPGQDELNFCGRTGWYRTAGEMHRDEDWFTLMASGTNIHVEAINAPFLSTDVDVLFLDGCQSISLLPYHIGICETGSLDIPTQPGEIVFLRVRPHELTRPECALAEDLYTLQITGIGSSVVETEAYPWDALKCMFR